MQQILDFLTSFQYRFINVWLLIGNNFKKKKMMKRFEASKIRSFISIQNTFFLFVPQNKI